MTALCSPSALRQPVRRTVWLAWLLVALLWASVWGQWHGLAHQVRQVGAQDVAALSVSAAAATPGGVSDQDDADKQGSAPCQLLDHLLHAGGLATAQAKVPQAACSSATPKTAPLDRVPQGLWGLAQARAPPHRI